MKPFELKPFQRTGVEFLISHPHALLADEMGTGKTYQVLEAINQIIPCPHTLIICPASLCLMWEQAIKQWFCDPQIILLKSHTEKIMLNLNKRVFIICSYNYLQKVKNVERLKKLKWTVIVADEAQALKNWTSKTTKGFTALAERTLGYLWFLTGTPATNSGSDYYPFLRLIEGQDVWGTLSEFQQKYCVREYNIWAHGPTYGRLKEEARPILKKVFRRIMLRRLKKDVVKELKGIFVSKQPVEIDEDIVAVSAKVDKAVVRECIIRNKPIPAHVMRVCTSIGLGKVSAAVEYIKNCPEPLVVFCTHRDVLRAITEEMGRPFGVVTGDESGVEKHRAVEDFQSGKIDLIFLNVAAGGVGITLTRASHMLFVELPWSAAARDQARSRCDRIGQECCVNVTELIAAGTIDEDIEYALSEKERMTKLVMGDTE